MPQRTKEEKQAYQKEYRRKNKEKLNEYHREYIKQYHIKNKDKRLKEMKEYRKTETWKKSHRISLWKQQGILCFDYELLYHHYINTKLCEYCNIVLTEDKTPTGRCLDHDHSITDKFNIRGVLCFRCNSKDVLK